MYVFNVFYVMDDNDYKCFMMIINFVLFLMYYIGSVWCLGVPAVQPCDSLLW